MSAVWSIVLAECIKLRGRSVPVFSALILVGGSVFVPIVVWALAAVDPARYSSICTLWLGFPVSVLRYRMALEFGGLLLISLAFAEIVGGEYVSDTWKMVLPRMANRYVVILVKLILIIGASATVLVAGGVVYSSVGVAVLVLKGEVAVFPVSVAAYVVPTILTVLELLFYATCAFAVALFCRSTVAGALAGVSAPIVLSLVTFRQVAIVLPNVHFLNLSAHLANRALFGYVDVLLGTRVSPLLSAGALVAYVVAIVGLALVVFGKRDILGK